jgi:hypothetical protein
LLDVTLTSVFYHTQNRNLCAGRKVSSIVVAEQERHDLPGRELSRKFDSADSIKTREPRGIDPNMMRFPGKKWDWILNKKYRNASARNVSGMGDG